MSTVKGLLLFTGLDYWTGALHWATGLHENSLFIVLIIMRMCSVTLLLISLIIFMSGGIYNLCLYVNEWCNFATSTCPAANTITWYNY